MRQPIVVKREKTIDASIEEIWNFVEPAQHIARWYPGGIHSEKITGEGKGRKQLLFGKWGKKEAELVLEIMEYEIHKLIRWKQLREVSNGKEITMGTSEIYFSILLSPIGEKTRISLQSEILQRSGWKALRSKLIARPRIEKLLESALNNIEKEIHTPQLPKESLMDSLL